MGARAGLGGAPTGQRPGIGRLAFGGCRQSEIELAPLRARERPFGFVPPHDGAAALADGELHWRLVHEAVVDALEPAVEEPQLIATPVLRIERMHVGAGMDAELLL